MRFEFNFVLITNYKNLTTEITILLSGSHTPRETSAIDVIGIHSRLPSLILSCCFSISLIRPQCHISRCFWTLLSSLLSCGFQVNAWRVILYNYFLRAFSRSTPLPRQVQFGNGILSCFSKQLLIGDFLASSNVVNSHQICVNQWLHLLFCLQILFFVVLYFFSGRRAAPIWRRS